MLNWPVDGMPDELLYLTRSEVRSLLPPLDVQLGIAEQTYRAMARGEVELPPKPGIHPRENSFIHAMPAYLRSDDVAALKWIAGYQGNKRRGMPYISGLIVVSDPGTGCPTAVMDAVEITAARTAAASGVCARHWAPSTWESSAVIGCGAQGRAHARVLVELNPSGVVRSFDTHPERAASLPARRLEPAGSPREAVSGAQVVVTAGPILDDPRPCIGPDWLGGDWLLLPIDLDSYLTADATMQAELFLVDDVAQFEYYRSLGYFRGWPVPMQSVGEALESAGNGYRRVVCANLGVAALDAAFAAGVLERAGASGVGLQLER
jgi:alanine dehydrogenase